MGREYHANTLRVGAFCRRRRYLAKEGKIF